MSSVKTKNGTIIAVIREDKCWTRGQNSGIVHLSMNAAGRPYDISEDAGEKKRGNTLHELIHVIEHTLVDSLKLVPFLFLTYLVMEYLEHKAGDKMAKIVNKAGKWGPLAGGIAGAAPQCGFSAAASNLYAGRIISLGTLIAIYLSTSDEMLPIMISEKQPLELIMKILAAKVVIGVLAGFVIDLVFSSRRPHKDSHEHIHEICAHENCRCEEGVLRSAVSHTLQITLFIILITFVLNLFLEFGGEDILERLVLDRPVLGPVLAGIVGLIPNCAASVAITQLYLSGALGVGSMMAGLLTGSGVGLLVLFRVNHNRKENFSILGLVYLIGVAAGVLIELIM